MPDTTVRGVAADIQRQLEQLVGLGNALGGDAPWRRAARSSAKSLVEMSDVAGFGGRGRGGRGGAAGALAGNRTSSDRSAPSAARARRAGRQASVRSSVPPGQPHLSGHVPSSCSRPSWRRISLAAPGIAGATMQRRPAQRLAAAVRGRRASSAQVLGLLRERPGLRARRCSVAVANEDQVACSASAGANASQARSRWPSCSGCDLRLVADCTASSSSRRRTCAPSRWCGSAGCRGRCRGRTRSAGTAPRR